jgi:hypothetical protein
VNRLTYTKPIGRFVASAADLYRIPHRILFDYWQARRPDDTRLPGRSAIDPAGLRRILSNVWMTDVVRLDGEVYFRERLVGTALTELFGQETTGKFFEEIYKEPHLSRQLATYRHVVAHGRPHLSRLRVPKAERDHVVYDRLILPLAADGETVDLLLGAHAYEAWPGEDPDEWPEPDAQANL